MLILFNFSLTTATEKIKANAVSVGFNQFSILSGSDITLKDLSVSAEALGSTVVPIVQIQILGKLLKFQV